MRSVLVSKDALAGRRCDCTGINWHYSRDFPACFAYCVNSVTLTIDIKKATQDDLGTAALDRSPYESITVAFLLTLLL